MCQESQASHLFPGCEHFFCRPPELVKDSLQTGGKELIVTVSQDQRKREGLENGKSMCVRQCRQSTFVRRPDLGMCCRSSVLRLLFLGIPFHSPEQRTLRGCNSQI